MTLIFILSVLFVAIIIAIVLFTRRRENSKIETVPLRNVPHIKIAECESDFIQFICKCARNEKVETDSIESVEQYFVKNFQSLKLSYVYQTKSILALNNIPKVLHTAAKKYCNK